MSDDGIEWTVPMLDAACVPLNHFARVIFGLGYQPSDCLIQTCDPPLPLHGRSTRIDKFLVLGECHLELATHRDVSSGRIQCSLEIRSMSLPAPAHQDSARPMSGESST